MKRHTRYYLPPRRVDKPPEFYMIEYQYIEALVVIGKFGHDTRVCAGCELCASINALRARIGNNRLQAVMMAVADRLGLKHE